MTSVRAVTTRWGRLVCATPVEKRSEANASEKIKARCRALWRFNEDLAESIIEISVAANIAQEAIASQQLQFEIFCDRLSDVRQRAARTQVDCRFRQLAKDQQRRIFARVVGAS